VLSNTTTDPSIKPRAALSGAGTVTWPFDEIVLFTG
jgi:hypothetical protein